MSACRSCGAALDDDAKFCSGCGTAVSEPEPAPEATGQMGKIVGILVGVSALVAGIAQLSNRPEPPKIEVIEAPEINPGPDPASVRTRGAPRELTSTEQAVAGTWVARSHPRAVNPDSATRMMTDMKAIQSGKAPEMPEACTWLELYDNLTGMQSDCRIINGEPSVFDQQTLGSGSKKSVGVSFTWKLDDRLRIHYDTPLVLESAPSTRITDAVFELKPGSSPIHAMQTFPEHPDQPPVEFVFEVLAGAYLSDSL